MAQEKECLACLCKQVYGPTLCPVDNFEDNHIATANGHSMGTAMYTQLMRHTTQVGERWATVAGIDAAVLYNRTAEVLKRAERALAHRLPPHEQALMAMLWKLVSLHPAGPAFFLHLLWPNCGLDANFHMPCVMTVRGFSAGSYMGATLGMVAASLPLRFDVRMMLGGIAMPPFMLLELARLAKSRQDGQNWHQIRLIQVDADKLCRWLPPDVLRKFSPELHVTHVHFAYGNREATALFNRIFSPSGHNYAHLLDVDLPNLQIDFQTLLCAYHDARPLSDQLAIPMRLASLMRPHITIDLEPLMRLVSGPKPALYRAARRLFQLPEDCPMEQLKHTLLAQFSLAGSKRQSQMTWLNTLARESLAKMDFSTLVVLLHAFLPQIAYSPGSSRMRSSEKYYSSEVARVKPSCQLSGRARGRFGLHEFAMWFLNAGAHQFGAFVPQSEQLWDLLEKDQTAVMSGMHVGYVVLMELRCDFVPLAANLIDETHDDKTTEDLKPDHTRVGSRQSLHLDATASADVPSAAAINSPDTTRVGSREEAHESDNTLPAWMLPTWEGQSHSTPAEIAHHVVIAGIVSHVSHNDAKDRPEAYRELKGLQFVHVPNPQQWATGCTFDSANMFWGLPRQFDDLVTTHRVQPCNMFLVSPTLDSKHLHLLGQLAPRYRPLVLGVAHDEPCEGTALGDSVELIASLHTLFEMLVCGDFSKLTCAPQFARQLLQEARTDGGHLITIAVALLQAIRTERSTLAISGIFGAGKTTAVGFLLTWLILTTKAPKFVVVSKENAAGTALVDIILRFHLTDEQKNTIKRVVGKEKWKKYSEEPADGITMRQQLFQDPAAKPCRLLICTTGICYTGGAFKHSKNLMEHIECCTLFFHEEAQQAIDILSAFNCAIPKNALLIFIGDDAQSAGGLDRSNPAAQALRSELLRLPIGLRAPHRWFGPDDFVQAICQTINGLPQISRAMILQHAEEIVHRSVHSSWTAQGGSKLTEMISHLHVTYPTLQMVDLWSPVGLCLAFGFILSSPQCAVEFSLATSTMEAAGLVRSHHWAVVLPSSGRVVPCVYTLLTAGAYPALCKRRPDGEWRIGTGTRRTSLSEEHGFRFVYWYDHDKRRQKRKQGEKSHVSSRAVGDIYKTVNELFGHLPVWGPGTPVTTPGQLVATNSKFLRNAIRQGRPAPKLTHNVTPAHSDSHPLWWQRNAGYPLVNNVANLEPALHTGKSKGTQRYAMTRVDNTVSLAGATSYRTILIQSGVSFLSGNHWEDTSAEAFARAVVGFSRAIGSTIFVSPLDMRGLPGLVQVWTTLALGFVRIDTDSHGVQQVVIAQSGGRQMSTIDALNTPSTHTTIGKGSPPLALVWATKQKGVMVFQRLHLILIETPRGLKLPSHSPALPGGTNAGLMWGYAVDNDRRPTFKVLPDVGIPQGWVLQHCKSMALIQGAASEYMQLAVLHSIHFFDAWRLRPLLHTIGDMHEEWVLAPPELKEWEQNPLAQRTKRRRQEGQSPRSKQPPAQGPPSESSATSSHDESTVLSSNTAASSSMSVDSSTRPTRSTPSKKWVPKLRLVKEDASIVDQASPADHLL